METAFQPELAVEAGCDELQRYFFARPLDEPELEAMLSGNGMSLAA